MDATRSRRRRDPARQTWYASHRQRRFARFMGFVPFNRLSIRVAQGFRAHVGYLVVPFSALVSEPAEKAS